MPVDPEFHRLAERIRAGTSSDVARLFVAAVRLGAMAFTHLLMARRTARPGPGTDRWMSLTKAAEMLDVHPKWLWRHRHELPFVHTIDGRRWRVSKNKLHEHMARKGG